jgi:taurine transport system substrate-binding protein
VLTNSKEVGAKGFPTFDGMVVNGKWASEHPAFMVALVRAIAKADLAYKADRAKWTADSAQVKAIAKWTKAEAKDVPPSMALYGFPTMEEQIGPKWLGGAAAKALTDTAAFLKEQGRVQETKPDYKAFVTTEWVTKAMGK